MGHPSKTASTTPKPSAPAKREKFIEAVVDNQFIPSSSLITHIEGSEWIVNYFRQLLGEGQQPTGLALTLDRTAQQYEEIIGLELKVDGALESSQIEGTGEMEVTGSSTLYPGIQPNIGDMFVTDTGDGRLGIFEITSQTRLSILKETCYRIIYVLRGYYNDVTSANIQSKVVKSVTFRKEYLIDGENPFLVASEVQVVDNLAESYSRLIKIYFKEFYSEEYSTFLVPNDTMTVYDLHLNELLKKCLSNDDLSGMPTFNTLTCGGDINTRVTTVWDSLLNLNSSLLYLVSSQSRLVNATEFSDRPFFESIALTGINKVVYPKLELTHREKTIGKTVNTLRAESVTEVSPIYGNPKDNVVYSPGIDSYYVFSKNFYDDNSEFMSLLELTVRQFLAGQTTSIETLTTLVNDISTWSTLSRYYYIPVLLMMIKVSIKEI